MQSLADRLAQRDMVPLADWQAAERLNKPDPSLPIVVEQRWTSVAPLISGEPQLELVERHQSWAEAAGMHVDARAVGLARGGR